MRHFLSCEKHSADSTHHGDPVLFSMGVGSTCVYPIQLLHSLLQPLIVNPFSPYFGIAGRKNTVQRWPIEHVQDCLAQHCSGLEEPHPFLPHLSPSLLGSLDTTESVSSNDKESDRANKKQVAMGIKVPPYVQHVLPRDWRLGWKEQRRRDCVDEAYVDLEMISIVTVNPTCQRLPQSMLQPCYLSSEGSAGSGPLQKPHPAFIVSCTLERGH